MFLLYASSVVGTMFGRFKMPDLRNSRHTRYDSKGFLRGAFYRYVLVGIRGTKNWEGQDQYWEDYNEEDPDPLDYEIRIPDF